MKQDTNINKNEAVITVSPVMDEKSAIELYKLICATGYEKYALSGGIDTQEGFLEEVLNMESIFFSCAENGKPKIVFWLNRFESRLARIHFCTFGQPETMTKAEMCNRILRQVLTIRRQDGTPFFDCLEGHLAISHKPAIIVAKEAGGLISAKVPFAGISPFTGNTETGVYIAFTAESIGIDRDTAQINPSLAREVRSLMDARRKKIFPCADAVRKVFIITHCRKPELMYGTSLVFNSIRTGFPFAEINVIDNGSLSDALPAIRNLASSVNARMIEIAEPDPHELILDMLINHETEPFAVVDPDVIFWDRMDSLEGLKGSLLAGRLIPEFKDPYTGCLTKERLHTSMLIVPDPCELKAVISEIKAKRIDWNPVSPVMFESPEGWIRFDTMGVLYASIKDRCRVFDEYELNRYDHLFCGSHIDLVAPAYKNLPVLDAHNLAKEERFDRLKGIWRTQQELLESMA